PEPPAPRRVVGERAPLTPLQRAFHTNGRLYPDVTAYAYVRQTVEGPLDGGLLGRAFAVVAERHPMLRLRIADDHQRAVPPEPYPAPSWYEVREAGAGRPPLADLEEALCNRPFDLAVEAPVRAVLVREGADTARLLLLLHHAAADGFSLNVLSEELWSAYTALAHARDPELPPPATDFATHVVAATEAERATPRFAEDHRYWRDRLAAHAGPLELPWDGDPTAPPAAPLTAHESAAADPRLTTALRELAAAHGVTPFHLLLAAYARCLARWSGRHEIAVNVARARRENLPAGAARMVGPLADTLPLLATVDPDEPLPALARRLRATWLDAERHARLGSLDIARLLPAAGPGPRTASPAGFSFARFPVAVDPDCPVTVRPTAARTASAATRLGLLCWESDGALRFSWNFPAQLFARATVARLADEYLAELARLQKATEEVGPRGGIVERLGARFLAAADRVAVDTGTTTLTYRELDHASAALAGRLRARGVAPGDLVGLLVEPGADTVVGVVGILRAGAGWVPLDATHPAARLADQLRRTAATTVACHAATRATADALHGVTAVSVDDPAPAPATG
ncbi:condensation domain-containing protein, partial [Streptomyces hainanensis]